MHQIMPGGYDQLVDANPIHAVSPSNAASPKATQREGRPYD
ncbi:hypothetical protein [Salinispora pacifica]|nr:hypothetical protein [Salinispora pacifica]